MRFGTDNDAWILSPDSLVATVPPPAYIVQCAVELN